MLASDLARAYDWSMEEHTCEFTGPDTGEKCGKSPTQPLAIGMTDAGLARGESGIAGEFLYSHYCEEHLPAVQRQLGQK